MCIAPIILENPYFNRGVSFDHDGSTSHIDFGGRLDYLHNTIDRYISVPCGKCSQCISARQNYYVQRIQMESIRSEIFYFTLTYANRGLKFTDKLGYEIPYPHYEDIQNLFKRLRKKLPHPIETFVVSEYGEKRKRPHFHGFIAVRKTDIKEHYRSSHLYCEKVLFKEVLFEWRRNISLCYSPKKGKMVANTRSPHWIKLCDFVFKRNKRTFDLHWVEPIVNHDNDTSYYVTKYLLKYDERTQKLLDKLNIERKKNAYEGVVPDSYYKELISQLKPRAVMSKRFGDYRVPEIQAHIKKGIRSNSKLPQFLDINTGCTMLLAPYYRKHLVGIDYYFERWWNYLHQVQTKGIVSLGIDSYNPEYLDESTVHDLNCASSRKQRKDRHLRRVKLLVNKKQSGG